MSPTTPYAKPPEPTWSTADELRFLVELLRAAKLQAGVLHKRCKGNLNGRIGQIYQQLHNGEKGLVHAVVSTGKLGEAEDYFDNNGALLWESCNEVRKQPDRRNALSLLYALTAGAVVASETGLPVGQEPLD